MSQLSENVFVTYKNGIAFPSWKPTLDEAKAVAQANYAPQAPVAAVPAAQMHDTGDGFGNRPIWYGDRPPIGTLLFTPPLHHSVQADDGRDALIRDLLAALKPFAEEEPEHEAISEDNELVAPRWLDATYGQYRAARAALAKAKQAGYEP